MKLVSLAKYRFILEPRYHFYGWSKSPEILARPSAVKALIKARSLLPKGYNFKIWDGYRSLKIQVAMLNSIWRRLRIMYPRFSHKKREELLFMFGGRRMPPRHVKELNTHRNGGAFDLTIVDQNDYELYMATDHDDLTEKAALNYFEKKKRLTSLERIAKNNRRLLKRVMTKAGFKIYEPEWWHWGYNK